MKVAIPVSSGLPSSGGGYTFESQIIAALIKADSEIKHELWFFDLSKGTASYYKKGIGNCKIIRPPQKTLQSYNAWLIQNGLAVAKKIGNPRAKFLPISHSESWYVKLLSKHQFDLTWLLSPYALNQPPPLSIPFVFTVWDLQHRLQPYFPEVSLNKEWDTREVFYTHRLQQATYLITGTHQGKQELEHFYRIAPERIRVIPFPTPDFALENQDTKAGKADFLKQKGLPKSYFFYPAQFWPHKNHFSLLMAAKLLRDSYRINVSLVFTGSDKGNLEYIKQLVQRFGLEDNVHFLGFVSQSDLIQLYQFAEALVFPTYFGPDNLPPLEAFALGCPVIASDVPGASEQLGQAALLVKPNNFEKLALAMKSVCEDRQLRQRLIQAGLERAKLWTTKDYIYKMMAILDEFELIRYCWPNSQYATSSP